MVKQTIDIRRSLRQLFGRYKVHLRSSSMCLSVRWPASKILTVQELPTHKRRPRYKKHNGDDPANCENTFFHTMPPIQKIDYSLVSQGLDRVEARGAQRRVNPEDQSRRQ